MPKITYRYQPWGRKYIARSKKRWTNHVATGCHPNAWLEKVETLRTPSFLTPFYRPQQFEIRQVFTARFESFGIQSRQCGQPYVSATLYWPRILSPRYLFPRTESIWELKKHTLILLCAQESKSERLYW